MRSQQSNELSFFIQASHLSRSYLLLSMSLYSISTPFIILTNYWSRTESLVLKWVYSLPRMITLVKGSDSSSRY